MSEIERLGSDQLAHLERLLAEQKAPVVQRFQPPVSRAALTEVEAYLELPLPNELRQWWGWHDGTDIERSELAVEGSIGPSFRFLRTERAIQFSREGRELAEKAAPEEPDSLWLSSWLAIGSGGRVACECAVDIDAPVPILDVDYHHTDVPGTVAARSFGEMVSWWIEALESGAWRYNIERNRWERREELVPPERESVGLV